MNDNFSTIKDTVIVWGHLNKTGVFALDYDPINKEFLLLGTDRTNNCILFSVSSELEYDNSYYNIPDSALGIAVAGNSKIYLSLPDRRIEKFTRP